MFQLNNVVCIQTYEYAPNTILIISKKKSDLGAEYLVSFDRYNIREILYLEFCLGMSNILKFRNLNFFFLLFRHKRWFKSQYLKL